MATKADFLTAMTATTKIGGTKAFSSPNTTTEAVTATAHGKTTGFGPVRLNVSAGGGDALPTGLSGSTDYWLIVVDANTVKFATSYANAVAGTPVDISGAGQGTFSMQCTMQTLANNLEQVVQNHLTFPGNKDSIAEFSIGKFWAFAAMNTF